tara:strand:+ start:223 stop:522 length:300 start_codon:yes stop_codon:yes gene_type:complete
MTIKPTFFNTRVEIKDNIERLCWDYEDTNSYLFTILFNNGAELNFILRDLKKNKNTIKHIYNKLYTKFSNVFEIHTSKLNLYEYNLMKQYNIPSVIKIC